ncbi:MAG TPA: hypothetical protein VKE74_14445 [Gemmataceae bacterium]|nr:hypothetical protein [Gemmataceae bacterium]
MASHGVTAADARRFRRKLFWTATTFMLFGFGLCAARVAGHLVAPKLLPQMSPDELAGDLMIRISGILLFGGLVGLVRSALVRIPKDLSTLASRGEPNPHGPAPTTASQQFGLSTARWLHAKAPANYRPAEQEPIDYPPAELTDPEPEHVGVVRWKLVLPLAGVALLGVLGTLEFLARATSGPTGSGASSLVAAFVSFLVGVGCVWATWKLGRSRSPQPAPQSAVQSAPTRQPAAAHVRKDVRCWSSD